MRTQPPWATAVLSVRQDTAWIAGNPHTCATAQNITSIHTVRATAALSNPFNNGRPAANAHSPEARMHNETEEAPLLPGLKPVLELLSSDPQRIDCVFCKKGLRGADAQEVLNLCTSTMCASAW